MNGLAEKYTLRTDAPPVIVRSATLADLKIETCAVFSVDELARYYLAYGDDPAVLWIMLNPSTATELKPDPTCSRILEWSLAWGYSGIRVVNLSAFRSSKPRGVRDAVEKYTEGHNLGVIVREMRLAHRIVCAWGACADPWAIEAAERVRSFAAVDGMTLHAMDFNQDGSPKHPVARGRHRIPNDATPVVWSYTT